MTGKDVLLEEDLLEKAATIKRFEYSPLASQLKIHIDIAKMQYQRFDKVYEFDVRINRIDRQPTLEKYNKLDLIYNANDSFYK